MMNLLFEVVTSVFVIASPFVEMSKEGVKLIVFALLSYYVLGCFLKLENRISRCKAVREAVGFFQFSLAALCVLYCAHIVASNLFPVNAFPFMYAFGGVFTYFDTFYTRLMGVKRGFNHKFYRAMSNKMLINSEPKKSADAISELV